MNSWLILSPILNVSLFMVLIANAMAFGPKLNPISNTIFMVLFANIVATAVVALW